ncbi:MAG: phosphoribosyl transferase [Planctomycetota bacterium]|nr:MAG: phosphoribosyl transferase [Planctomycetota bacterium]
MGFHDRSDAGRRLAELLARFRHDASTLVLALPRGGVPVGYEIARAIGAPLDIILVRKLGYPLQPELAMGAIASGGVIVLHEDAVESLDISRETIERAAQRELRELERQEAVFRGRRPPPDIAGRTVILVDDGLATGSTMRAAVQAVRQQRPRRLIVAVPVGAASTCAEFAREVDEVVCLHRPADFRAVGLWYDDFTPTSDETVTRLLTAAAQRDEAYAAEVDS